MLNVGDNVICKESLSDWYTIGKTYFIIEIKGRQVLINDNVGDSFWFDLLVSSFNDIFNIWRVFYSPNELRKLKLKELEFMQKV
jgi:hypothetical protein